MNGKNFDFGGCLLAVFALMVLLGCLFGTTEKLFGDAGEAVGYAVTALIAVAIIRYIVRGSEK